MKTKNKIVLSSLVISISLLLTACGGGGGDTGPNPNQPPQPQPQPHPHPGPTGLTSYNKEVKIPDNPTFHKVILSSESSHKNNDLDGVGYNYKNTEQVYRINWNVGYNYDDSKTLTNFSTVQFVVSNEDQLKNIQFKVSDSPCIEIDYKNQQFYQKSNELFDLTKLDGASDLSHAPLHLSVFGFKSDNCSQHNNFNAKDMLAVFISQNDEQSMDMQSPLNNQNKVCTIKKPLNLNSPIKDAKNKNFEYAGLGSNCRIERPHFEIDPNFKYIDYVGTLKNWAYADNIDIEIPLGTTVSLPLTTEYVRIPLPKTLSDKEACSKAINDFNNQPYLGSTSNDGKQEISDSCQLGTNDSKTLRYALVKHPTMNFVGGYRNFTFSGKNNHFIKIHGFGRINGADIPSYGKDDDETRAMSKKGTIWVDHNTGNVLDDTVLPGLKLLSYAQYRIESSLLGLDSQAQVDGNTTSSIDITGITIANGLRRNRGAIQLNVAQFGPLKKENMLATSDNEDRNSDNTPTSMFDVKQVGFFKDAVDGADVGSDYSRQSFMYSQIADDTVKIEAKHQTVDHYTVIHGNSGSVVMPGMYGVVRDSLQESVISNVYIHRDMSPGYNNDTWSSYGGIIATKDCLRFPTNQTKDNYDVKSLTFGGFKINRLYLLSHGHEDGSTMSNYIRLFNLNAGTQGNFFCKDDFDVGSTMNRSGLLVKVYPITLKNIKIDVVPTVKPLVDPIENITTDTRHSLIFLSSDGWIQGENGVNYNFMGNKIKKERFLVGCDSSTTNSNSCFWADKSNQEISGGIQIKNNTGGYYDYLGWVGIDGTDSDPHNYSMNTAKDKKSVISKIPSFARVETHETKVHYPDYTSMDDEWYQLPYAKGITPPK